MFITIEDETGVANLVLWPDRYASQRRLVLSASMLACHGRMQREGEVVHVIADRLEDLSEMLRGVGERDGPDVEVASQTSYPVWISEGTPTRVRPFAPNEAMLGGQQLGKGHEAF